MTQRYVDKKIQVLELISKNNFKSDCISNIGTKMADYELQDILEELQYSNLIEIFNRDLVGVSYDLGNSENNNEIVVYFRVKDKNQITSLLERFKTEYPRRNKPIIREKTLEKIAKYFANLGTESEIAEVFKEINIPEFLFDSRCVSWRIIFDILNHYAYSLKKADFIVFKKIIEKFIHPLMFDGNKKEAKGIVDAINSLIEYDDFMIKDGILQKQNFNNDKVTSRKKLIKKPFSGENKVEFEVGELASYKDGTIRYADEVLEMRNQIKDLCRLFMDSPKRLLTIDDIKEQLIKANKRGITPNNTISKYVCELRSVLKNCFKKEIIFNQKREGWILDINRNES